MTFRHSLALRSAPVSSSSHAGPDNYGRRGQLLCRITDEPWGEGWGIPFHAQTSSGTYSSLDSLGVEGRRASSRKRCRGEDERQKATSCGTGGGGGVINKFGTQRPLVGSQMQNWKMATTDWEANTNCQTVIPGWGSYEKLAIGKPRCRVKYKFWLTATSA